MDVQLVEPGGRLVGDPGTPADAADQLGVPLEVLLDHNPGLSMGDFIPEGT